MNVAICSSGSVPGHTAAAGRILNICKGLAASGAQCQLFYPQSVDSRQNPKSDFPFSFSPVDIGVASVPNLLWRFPYAICQSVRKAHLVNKFDAVYAYCDISLPWFPLARLCHEEGIPFVGDFTEWHRFRLRLLRKYHFWDRVLFHDALWRRINGVVAISSWFVARADRSGKPSVLVPPPLDFHQFLFTAQSESSNEPFTVTYMGAMPYRDLPLTMLRAVHECLQKGMNLKLRIIGPIPGKKHGGPTAQIRQLLQAGGLLCSRTEFTGRVDAPTLSRLLQDTNALILLRDNHTENQACFPTRLPEYLYTGRPLIVSRFGDLPLYLKETEVVFVPPGDATAPVVEALASLYGNKVLCQQIGQKGKAAALRAFHFEKIGGNLYNFFSSLRKHEIS